MKSPIFKIGLLVLAVVLAAVPLHFSALAQGGLGEDELAALDRIVEARIQRDAYPAYTDETNGIYSLSFTVTEGEMQNSRSEVINWTRTTTVIPGDTYDNIQGTVTATYTYIEMDANGDQSFQQYVITAEVRAIEGVVYVNATYDESQSVGELPELPEGWVMIASEEELDQYPALEALQLDELFDEKTLDEVRDDVERLKSSATEVYMTEDTLEDGTPVERVIINVTGEGVPLYLADQLGENPLIDTVVAEGNNSIGMQLTVEDDNQPRGLDTLMNLEGAGLDGGLITPDLEGATVDFSINQGEFSVMTPLESAEPAVAPEEEMAAP